MPQRDVNKILILRFSSLGDIVMATPMIRCLRKRFPQAQIDMVVREDFLDLIQHNPHLDGKIGLPRSQGLLGLLQLRRKLNSRNYDLIYDAHRSLRTFFLMPFLRARRKLYLRKHYVRRDLALTFKLPLLKSAPRMIERYIDPLHALGVQFDNKGPEVLVPSGMYQAAASRVLLPPSEGKLTLGLIPSAQWPGKRWPLAHFRDLLLRLVDDTDYRILVFGGPEDSFCGELCQGLAATRVINTQGKLSIAESAALIARCALVIANDTGLMHVADASGVPSVLILGPTSKELGCLPYHPMSEIVEQDLWCRPCSKNGQAPCIRHKRLCLERTLPRDVLQAMFRLTAALKEAHP